MSRKIKFIAGCLGIAALGLGGVGAAEWSLKDGETIQGELSGFDFEEKRVIFRGTDDKNHPVPSEELSADSRWRLLVSPEFSRSFPHDQWTSEQLRYFLLVVPGPTICLLVSFYLCALLLLKNGSPWKALAGWGGSVLLGGFLMSFYLSLSGRSPASASGILIGGGLISALLLAFYVGIVYQTTTMNGMKVLILHVCGAVFFLALAIVAVRKMTQVFDCEPVIKEKIMIPVGLLPKE